MKILLGYSAVQRTTLLIEARRHAQELKAQREVEDKLDRSLQRPGGTPIASGFANEELRR